MEKDREQHEDEEKPMKAIPGAIRLALSCGAALVAAASGQALAQANTYPSKPIRWIVPYAPGGGTDILSRAVGQKLAESWSQTVLIENRPGGGTNIGAEMAAKAPPDGYTLLATTVANAINMTLFPKPGYDIVREFSHIANLAKLPNILVVHPAVPAKTVKDLIDLAKAKPNALRHGSTGIGSPNHLAAEIFKVTNGLQMTHVPYKGAGPALNDLAGGQFEVYFGTVVSTLPVVRNGRARVIGLTSLKRIEAAPDLPTLNEQGLKDFEIVSWVIMSAPARTPQDIITKLNREAIRALAIPEVRSRLSGDGAEFVNDSPEQVSAFVRAEVDKWGKAVKASGATPEN
jgi:tripartite-type tricarboxylate transporter receptor subunit TctC